MPTTIFRDVDTQVDFVLVDGSPQRNLPVRLVLDASQAIDPDRGRELVEGWRSRGLVTVSTDEVCI